MLMAINVSYIPLTSASQQNFHITLNGTQYYLVVTWCNAKKVPHYNLSIYYDSDMTMPVACGIPLVVDWGLTNQLRYLGLNFGLVCSNPSSDDEMEYGDLGVSYYLYVGVESDD